MFMHRQTCDKPEDDPSLHAGLNLITSGLAAALRLQNKEQGAAKREFQTQDTVTATVMTVHWGN